jgi:hypothetical protein
MSSATASPARFPAPFSRGRLSLTPIPRVQVHNAYGELPAPLVYVRRRKALPKSRSPCEVHYRAWPARDARRTQRFSLHLNITPEVAYGTRGTEAGAAPFATPLVIFRPCRAPDHANVAFIPMPGNNLEFFAERPPGCGGTVSVPSSNEAAYALPVRRAAAPHSVRLPISRGPLRLSFVSPARLELQLPLLPANPAAGPARRSCFRPSRWRTVGSFR